MGQVLTLFCNDCCKKLDDENDSREPCEGFLLSNDDEEFFGDGSDLKTDAPSSLLQLYSVGKLVGSGATSNVYKAGRKHGNGPTQVKLACKVIDKRKLIGMASQEIELGAVLSQLRKEIQILKRIEHPNIVGFHDFIETKDVMFLLMEYIAGDELFNYVNQNGPLDEHLARQVMYGTLSAVSYLHDRGVLHRDIKAENIMIRVDRSPATGQEEVTLVKLIDFGFSTTLRRTDFTGSFLGTDGYIAPEIRQQRMYNTSIDDWALGVLGFCILSGQLPFATSHDVLPWERRACSKMFKLNFPGKRWERVSTCCKDLLSKLLEVDPLKRITAKQALLHPWFTPMQPKKRPIGSFNNLIATALANSHSQHLAEQRGQGQRQGQGQRGSVVSSVGSPSGRLLSDKRTDSSTWSDKTASTVDSTVSLNGLTGLTTGGLVIAIDVNNNNSTSKASPASAGSGSSGSSSGSIQSPFTTPKPRRASVDRKKTKMSMSQPLIDLPGSIEMSGESKLRTYSKIDDTILVDGIGIEKPLQSMENPLRHVQSTSLLESSSDNYYSHAISRSASRANTPRTTVKKDTKRKEYLNNDENGDDGKVYCRTRGVSLGSNNLSDLLSTVFAEELNRSLITLSHSGSSLDDPDNNGSSSGSRISSSGSVSSRSGPVPNSTITPSKLSDSNNHSHSDSDQSPYLIGSFADSSRDGLPLSLPRDDSGVNPDSRANGIASGGDRSGRTGTCTYTNINTSDGMMSVMPVHEDTTKNIKSSGGNGSTAASMSLSKPLPQPLSLSLTVPN